MNADPATSQPFSRHDAMRQLRERRNWGRWGDDDQIGSLNLITPAKKVQAAGLVKTGRAVSLARPVPVHDGAPAGTGIADHFMDREPQAGGGGWSNDFISMPIHGTKLTHVDALCHVWDDDGMYNGRAADSTLTFKGSTFADIDAFKDGVITRGILLDIPGLRRTAYVTQEDPVHGWELERACEAQGVQVGSGDALAVYSGRERWSESQRAPWGPSPRPGLHASCLEFIRDHDVAVLVWDMMDMLPNGLDMPWSVHGSIIAFGTVLVDNALLEPLAAACADETRSEFLFMLAPLRMPGATGSPANPLALF